MWGRALSYTVVFHYCLDWKMFSHGSHNSREPKCRYSSHSYRRTFFSQDFPGILNLWILYQATAAFCHSLWNLTDGKISRTLAFTYLEKNGWQVWKKPNCAKKKSGKFGNFRTKISSIISALIPFLRRQRSASKIRTHPLWDVRGKACRSYPRWGVRQRERVSKTHDNTVAAPLQCRFE